MERLDEIRARNKNPNGHTWQCRCCYDMSWLLEYIDELKKSLER